MEGVEVFFNIAINVRVAHFEGFLRWEDFLLANMELIRLVMADKVTQKFLKCIEKHSRMAEVTLTNIIRSLTLMINIIFHSNFGVKVLKGVLK